MLYLSNRSFKVRKTYLLPYIYNLGATLDHTQDGVLQTLYHIHLTISCIRATVPYEPITLATQL